MIICVFFVLLKLKVKQVYYVLKFDVIMICVLYNMSHSLTNRHDNKINQFKNNWAQETQPGAVLLKSRAPLKAQALEFRPPSMYIAGVMGKAAVSLLVSISKHVLSSTKSVSLGLGIFHSHTVYTLST